MSTFSAEVEVDLTDLADLGVFDAAADHEARRRLAIVAACPDGARLVIRVGKYRPPLFDPWSGMSVDHLHVHVVASGPELVRAWLAALRGQSVT